MRITTLLHHIYSIDHLRAAYLALKRDAAPGIDAETWQHFVTGFTADALLLAEKGLAGRPALWRLLPLHLELVLIGWTVQFVLGVAFWMLPRFAGGTSRDDGDRPGWAFWLLNPGVLLSGLGPAAGVSHTQLLGRALDAAAVVAFAIHAWARVRPATSGP